MVAVNCSEFSAEKETSTPTRASMERGRLGAVVEFLFSRSIFHSANSEGYER